MIKASRPVPPGLISPLEDRLCEQAPSHWLLQVNRLTGEGSLVGYFKTEQEALNVWPDLADLFPSLEPMFAYDDIEDRDWKEAYKDHFPPWSLGQMHWVPEWERGNYQVPHGHKALYLDPGMAFGTGLHETTRLCLGALIQFVERCDPKDMSCLDAGCGSGILALSAKMLGFGVVSGFDMDPDAVRISKENAASNNLSVLTSFRESDLNRELPEHNADLLLANVQADVLCENALQLLSAVRPHGQLVLSGILSNEADDTAEVFLDHAQQVELKVSLARKDEREWTLLLFERN